MKSSKIVLICILMFSLFAFHDCWRMEVGEIERRSLNLGQPDCRKEIHDNVECWCCHEKGTKFISCWALKTIPDAREICLVTCPPQKINF
ncbi:hypothetical protein ISN44_As10g007120 [Arabidopsis suecica]|uniref:Embryo surrounding factor 1 brassicaceae domain-containing protein n=1 Tax=Arabidopsis suecica TaxID=45249 RepID=A0A8T1ZWL9_ARASU|nr:hypothetical protein ISN44_As10g007120 [Arabidopsis suecica]